MKRNDRKLGDPTHIGPRGKDKSERRGRYDPGFTPTEKHMKDQLMRQFLSRDGQQGNSAAYMNSPVWCHCGRLNGTHTHRSA